MRLPPPSPRWSISPVHSSGEKTPAPARLWSLDVLRGVCAGIVFLSHWHLWSDFPPQGLLARFLHEFGTQLHDTLTLLTWPTGGHHPAVLGFFVLSGFCIHYPFERRALAGESTPPWSHYFRRRFLRIIPVYWAACALGAIFVVAQQRWPAPNPLLTLHADGSWSDILVRLTGVAGIYPKEIFAGNYILTTVTVEIFMYALYPLIHRAAQRGGWVSLGMLFLLSHALAIALLRFFTPYWVFNSVFMLGLFWFAGALAAHVFLTHRPRVSWLWVLATWLVFLGAKAAPAFPGLNLIKQALWGLVCTVAILAIVRLDLTRPQLARERPIRALIWLGAISYSLYALHTPAIMLASWALLQLGLTNYLLQLAATLLASIAATLGVYYGVERYFYRPAGNPLPLTPTAAATAPANVAV
jgi:peptidoglycan/LPS O-acetylase OafA/YrhL